MGFTGYKGDNKEAFDVFTDAENSDIAFKRLENEISRIFVSRPRRPYQSAALKMVQKRDVTYLSYNFSY